jgi:pimeloyl-ACP methyl ester carboxylesterase
MREANAQVQTAEIADASHYVHDDQSEVFNQVVADYLRGQLLQLQQ